jgi:hypothetical protein
MPYRILPGVCDEGEPYGDHLILLECGLLIDPVSKKIYNFMMCPRGKFTVENLKGMLADYGPPILGFVEPNMNLAYIQWPENNPSSVRMVFFYEIESEHMIRIKRFMQRCVLLLKLKILARMGRTMAKIRPYLKRGMPSEAAAALSTHAKYMPKRMKRV